MNILATIGLFILAMVAGSVIGFLITRIYIKHKSKKMGEQMANKIMNQDKVFFNDGEEVDFKKVIKSLNNQNGPIENNQ